MLDYSTYTVDEIKRIRHPANYGLSLGVPADLRHRYWDLPADDPSWNELLPFADAVKACRQQLAQQKTAQQPVLISPPTGRVSAFVTEDRVREIVREELARLQR